MTPDAIAIRPFRIDFPAVQLAELRRRIEATRWPSAELVGDRSQGAQRATPQALARYWTTAHGGGYTRYFAQGGDVAEAMGRQAPDAPTAKISRAFVDDQPVGNLTRDNILDNITLYWLTRTGASAARWYWEFGRFLAATAGHTPPPVSVPVGFTAFPGELWAAPRSWVETAYPGLAYYNAVDSGGHFAAWEEPELFSTELRAAFSALR